MTVKEFITEHLKDKKTFYLMPNILSNQKFTEPYWKYGFEISTLGALPKEIEDKRIIRKWSEDEGFVIIWENLKFDGKRYIDIE